MRRHVPIPKRQVAGTLLIESKAERPVLTEGLVGDDREDGRHDENFKREHLGDN